MFVDHLLDSSRYKDVAVFVQQTFTSVRLSTWEPNDGSVLKLIVFQFLAKAKINITLEGMSQNPSES